MENLDIKNEVRAIGKKVFYFTAVIASMFVIYWLVRRTTISSDYYNNFRYEFSLFGDDYGDIVAVVCMVFAWLAFTFPLVITAMIGKRFLYTKHPTLVLLTPLLAVVTNFLVLVVGIYATGLFVSIFTTHDYFSGKGGQILPFLGVAFFSFGFNFITSIIVSVFMLLTNKHE